MIKGIAADLHFHQWSAFAQNYEPKDEYETGNSRLDGLLQELRRLAVETHAAGGRNVVLAGDVFHVRGSVSPTVMNSVKKVLEACVDGLDITWVILAGNHDLEGKDSTELGSAVTALGGRDVLIANKPAVYGDMLLVPWFESIDKLKEAILENAKKITDGDDDLANYDLVLHAPIDGVIEGLPPHGLTADWLASLGFRRVFSGHYHNHKEFPGGVYSIGALAHHTWSDVGSKAGFLIVTDGAVEWRKSHLPEFIDLTTLDAAPDEIPFIVDKNYVRLKVETDKSAEVLAAREELIAMGAAGVLLQATPEPPERPDGVVVSAAAGASLERSIGEYVTGITSEPERVKSVLTEALSCLTAADAVETA